MAKVVYEHVTKRFGDVYAVNDLSLEIEDREFLVLVGPSGCGKSTVIRLLAGLETATAGTIYIGDRSVTGVPARDRDIAMVFQSYALYPHMSVYDNLAFGLKMHGMHKDQIRERVTQAAKALAIEDLLRRRPGQLSGGQRQRVALGRAIVREPQVFLFDEPLSNLDAKLRVQTRAELSKLHERLQTTFIYVTHDQVEAMTMASRIAVMKEGVLLQVGSPEELYFRPDNVFVAGFIGSPSMNFIAGVLRGTAEEITFEAPALRIAIEGERARALAEFAGQEVMLGVRPEDMHDPDFLPRNVRGLPIRTRVDVTEMMGNEKFLHVIVGEQTLLARVDPRTRARVGQEIELQLDIDRLHLFDALTQRAIGKMALPEELVELPPSAEAENGADQR